MSINVTVSGNPINIRRGRMVLTDLDQIKKNERERRRRLRLEQVRQQSKEISNRILERAKKIAKQELNKLEKDGQSELRRMHDRKIMDIQEKYQEDMEDIGQAHTAAALLPDTQAVIDEERRKNRLAALKRGQEAIEQQVRELEKKDDLHAVRQERLRQVREMENLRSSMVANLPSKSPAKEQEPKISGSNLEQESSNGDNPSISPKKKKTKRTPKKSSGKVVKSNVKVISSSQKIKTPQKIAQKQKQQKSPKFRSVAKKIITVVDVHEAPKMIEEEIERIEELGEFESDDQTPRKTMPGPCVTPTKADKVARYNPDDYTQGPSGSNSTSSCSSSTSASDDSSYFSDSVEQSNYNRISKPASQSSSKVHFYDHSTRQRNTYERPAGTVERVDVRNEPNAMDEAERVQRAESVKAQLIETRRINAQRRGEDAILREKVRRDYQALMQNLEHLTREERKLKAAQVQCNLGEDLHLRGNMRKEYFAERQNKMDRAFREILNCSAPPKKECSHFTERVITLPRREEPEEEKLPEWQYPPFPAVRKEKKVPVPCEEQEELSREEQILEMLKKVERQKRLLLQEFGASLPDNILNGSLKSLLEKESTTSTQKPCEKVPPPSPDIKVINMSSCDEKESSGKSKKSSDESRKTTDISRRSSDTRKRVVTKRITTMRRKIASPLKKAEIAVQTTEIERPVTEARDKSVQVELRTESRETSESVDTSIGPPAGHHPIEPKVTVITPQIDESSSGSNTSIITGLVIDIDKNEVKVTPRKKKSSLQISKRGTPKFFHKSRSMPSSKASSPAKKSSKSLPVSRVSSPRKSMSSSRTINIQVSRNGFNVKVDPSQTTKFAVDASTEKAELVVGEDSKGTGSRVPEAYRIQSHSRRSIRIRDTSEDTSTSFASPPPVRPGSMINALTNSTPILELLDSSANETVRVSRRDVSPVSTPDTPSPRTMMMPSNIPHPDRIGRMLRYSSNESPTNDSTLPSSIMNDRTTSTDPSESLQPERRGQGSRQPEVCSCKNPECKLMHMKINDVQDYAARNCPEILKKYEDLQNMCTERIASLTDLIEKVRNDKTGMDFSMVSSRDETKLMDLPPPRGVRDDLQSVRRLVENIEAIHNQLAKTLFESQRIITSEPVESSRLSTGTSTNIHDNVPQETVGTSTSPEIVAERATKPTIISDERVNVQLNRFKMNQQPQTMFLSTPERSSWPPSRAHRDEDVISKLSREILEQSKEESNRAAKVNKSLLTKLRVSPPKGFEDSREDKSMGKEQELEDSKKDFVPLLAGIPKIPRGSTSMSGANGRPKPPVTLLNGPYKTDLDSPVHELSTIIEFDTPDTGNRSHGTARSPTMKSKRILPGNSGGFRSPREAKPSVHVAPFPVEENRRVSSPTKLSSQVPARSEDEKVVESEAEKPDESNSATEKSNKELQCDEEEKQGLQFDFSINTGTTKYKEKVTSTSSNSFSGLSGVSEITTTPSSEILKYASSPEEMETALKKLGLGWAIATLKKTREASALSSSSNSDLTPLNTARKLISPVKNPANTLPDLSDLSSISIKEASKSTERAVLLKGRTSTPNMHDLNSNSGRSQCTTSSESFSLITSNYVNL